MRNKEYDLDINPDNHNLRFPKKKIKFMDEEFEIYTGSEMEIITLLTGLMVCGKEYYKLMVDLDIKFGDEKLQKFIENKFGK